MAFALSVRESTTMATLHRCYDDARMRESRPQFECERTLVPRRVDRLQAWNINTFHRKSCQLRLPA